MKNNVLKHFEAIRKGKSLFKYGGIHMSKGESLLGGYDIGNLVSNLADGNFESSMHVMVLGKSGMQGVPFQGLEGQKVDAESKQLKPFKTFFENTTGKEWALFDLRQIQKDLKKQKIETEDKTIRKMLSGYDYLVIIPEVTAAQFLE